MECLRHSDQNTRKITQPLTEAKSFTCSPSCAPVVGCVPGLRVAANCAQTAGKHTSPALNEIPVQVGKQVWKPCIRIQRCQHSEKSAHKEASGSKTGRKVSPMRGAHSDGRRQQADRCCGFGAEGRSYDKPFLHQQDQA